MIKNREIKITELHKVQKNKIGRINTNGMHKEHQENEAALHLALFGLDIEYIQQSNTKGTHNADFLIHGTIWELKSPNGSSLNAIERNFRAANNQASNIILDLRYFKIHYSKARVEALKQFKLFRRIRRMILIEKSGKTLDIMK